MSEKYSAVKKLVRNWNNYKYRFVPWLTFNLKNRTLNIESNEQPYVRPAQDEIVSLLTKLFQAFHKDAGLQTGPYTLSNHEAAERSKRNSAIMKDHFGFCVRKAPSSIVGGGTGVVLEEGSVGAGWMVALYPGTVYRPGDPLFFQSLANPFVLKCIDGVHVDGNDRNLSKTIYKSCVHRDQIGPFAVADLSWLTEWPLNPMAVGQYVNNQSKDVPCNVAYQEFDIPITFPLHLRRYLPNINFYAGGDFANEMAPHHGPPDRWVRIVALISTREIGRGEELFSSYFTVVK